jgi:diguanylate cyclase (GGDEF)-like protein
VTPRTRSPRSSRKSKPFSDQYANVDLANAGRFASRGWAAVLLIALGFAPFFPPTHAFGDGGWALAIASLVLVGGSVVVLLRRATSGRMMLAASFAGTALIGLFDWLAGSEAPYHHLYLLVVMSAALVQPARRLAAVMLTVALARFLPAAYDSGPFQPGDAAMEVIVWSGVGWFLLMLMRRLRDQRVALRRVSDEAERSARSDPLTGLRNRRAFDEDAALELERQRRTGQPVALAVLDLDGFKAINDAYGHQVGDDVLQAVAEALRDETRVVDQCYRWGGDEFAVILPASGRGAGKLICRRVAERLERESPLPGGRPLRLSAGVAEFDGEMTVDAGLAEADADLFAVKRARRSSGVS